MENKHEIYLDNAASTKPSDLVINKTIELMKNNYANPSSKNDLGINILRDIKKHSELLCEKLGIKTKELLFTDGGSESNNMAIMGICSKYKKGTIITTSIEHPSVLNPILKLKEQGFNVLFAKLNDKHQVDVESLKEIVDKDTILVSIMQVNNELGIINDIEKIYKVVKAKNKNTIVHVDGVQGFCKESIKFNYTDLYSISAHKIHGSKGVGALYIKDGVVVKPFILGGSQQSGMRGGTLNTYGIIPFCMQACENVDKVSDKKENIFAMKKELASIENGKNIFVNGDINTTCCYILNMSFLGEKAEVFVKKLSDKGIYASSGSACNSHNKNKNVLQKLGFSDEIASSSIRFSFSTNNTIEEIHYVKTAICEILGGTI